MKPEKPKTETSTRKSIMADLDQFCILSKEHDFIEVTEWSNGEGYDVCLGGVDGSDYFTITHGQLDALKYLIKKLNKS